MLKQISKKEKIKKMSENLEMQAKKNPRSAVSFFSDPKSHKAIKYSTKVPRP